MIIVHDIFICKPGNASKMAKLCKEFMLGQMGITQVLTDVAGQFNKVVLVSQYESLAEYEDSFKNMDPNAEAIKKMQEAVKNYHDMYLTGSREIYRTW